MIIATPGRILDLMDKNVAIMDSCRILVLDEVSVGICFGNSYFFYLDVLYLLGLCMVKIYIYLFLFEG